MKHLIIGILMSLIGIAYAAPPNVIIIIADDQGYGDFSAHGNPVLKTPHMDQFRKSAVRFTDFHVAPMCSPTRGQLMTGIDAMRNGCTAVCQGRSMMRAELPTMADYFAESGYATGHFGKWHLGDSYPHRPQDRGFQETVHHRAWGLTSLADHWDNLTDVYFDPVLSHNGVDQKYQGYCTDIFFNEAISWIEELNTKNQELRTLGKAKQPFFVYLPTNTPHVPNIAPEKYVAPYVGEFEGKKQPAEFYGMIANLDENLGRLETFLVQKKLKDNTLVIYLSDNGTQSNGAKEIFNAGMRDKKTSVYEGGHRVPCFVRWPKGKLKHGSDIAEMTQVQDLLPTLIELCSLDAMESPLPFDGTSLAGLLTGETKELPDRKLVVQYRTSGEPWDPAVVMWNEWRLLKPKKGRNLPAPGTSLELYNVSNDPGQQIDVADQHTEVVEAMSAHYDAWHQEAKPLFDSPRWIIVGSEAANYSTLYAQDWVGDYCDNGGGLTKAVSLGYWNVVVDRPGTYEIDLRRWSKESMKSFTEGKAGPDDQGFSARPIAAANLRIDGKNYTQDVKATDRFARFTVELPASKTQLSTALLDAEDRSLCSAMYVSVHRLNDGTKAALTPTSNREPGPRAPTASPAAKAKEKAKGIAQEKGKALTLPKLGPGDRLLADFEKGSHGDWTTTGTAFGKGPTTAVRPVAGYQGNQLIDSIVTGGGDAATGTLTSPPFAIEHTQLSFLIGGGNHPGKTCLNLIIDGEIVESATGPASKDQQGNKILQLISWDLSDWKGRKARIAIVDNASKGWGHIVVDHIALSNPPNAP